MLQFLRKLSFKNRIDNRSLIQNGSLVVVVPTKDGNILEWKVQVIDISLGGAAFIYEGSPDDLAKSGLIRFPNDVPDAVVFKTVSDLECSEGSTYRRRGVKFEWKDVLGKKLLDEFIKVHGFHAGGIN